MSTGSRWNLGNFEVVIEAILNGVVESLQLPDTDNLPDRHIDGQLTDCERAVLDAAEKSILALRRAFNNDYTQTGILSLGERNFRKKCEELVAESWKDGGTAIRNRREELKDTPHCIKYDVWGHVMPDVYPETRYFAKIIAAEVFKSFGT